MRTGRNRLSDFAGLAFPRLALAWAPLAIAIAIAGCGAGAGQGSATNDVQSEVIVASAFDNFCMWSNAPAMADTDAGDSVHAAGPLQVYWKSAPPAGATSFPVGTLILKESQEADVTTRTVFAMAKVGGSYNSGPDGAPGWKWFSLAQNPDCTVTELWSAPAPPSTESYAGMPAGDCNGCHALANNDFVWDSALQLAK